jgi:Concanavalin A-like lectin/glucanases superfamily/VanZ like family
MLFNKKCTTENIGISWRAPVITLVLAATAIPVELRPLAGVTVDLGLSGVDVSDVLLNVAGYLPVGIVLAEFGLAQAIIAAALLSMFAESSQLVMMHRDPSVIDVTANILGATLGAVISRHWRISSPALRVNRLRALVAAASALVLFFGMWATSGRTPNPRGVTAPGTLEAHWKFDESSGRRVIDSSGHGLNGTLEGRPKRVTGIMGDAIMFDGKRDCIYFGHSSALRLVGSMTISAWINSSSFPVDDAAIVSSLGSIGYQLDTTVDRGPRTIGFKLSNACDELMARYGATPLVVDTWYHVAGVYNAEAKTLDVYLNGGLDNGFLLGSVSSTQRSSREAVYVGRRSDSSGFEFAGSIGDVRIYSVALTKSQILAAMRGADIDVSAPRPTADWAGESPRRADRPLDVNNRCAVVSDPEDKYIPAAAGTLGALVAFACAGLWPSARRLPCMVISSAAGLLLLAATPPHLPSFNLWLIPLTSFAGGASVAVSLSRRNE